MKYIGSTGNPALDRTIDELEQTVDKLRSATIAPAQQQPTPQPQQQNIGAYVRTISNAYQVTGDVTIVGTGLVTISQSQNTITINVASTTLPPHPTRTVTAATYTAVPADETIELDTTANAVTVKLPTLPSALKYLALKWTAGANAATIDGNGANIDVSATFVFASLLDSIGVRQSADGTKWFLYS